MLLAVPALLLLPGCAPECITFKKEDAFALERAARHPEPGPHRLPADAWIENRSLEDLFRKALQTQRAGEVAARYGLRCTPRNQGPDCPDCFICRSTIPLWQLGSETAPGGVHRCVYYGDILVHAELGPKFSVKAMTYWQTSPAAREDMKRPLDENR